MQTTHIARAGLAAALIAVAAWISLPIGPVPFTLQTFALAMLPAAFDRKTAIAAVVVYLALGAIGLPVFAGFGAGLGTLAGPTGGFLWGFLIGMLAATAIVDLLPEKVPHFARALAGDAALLVISYVCGTIQLMGVASLDVAGALAIAVIPFIVPDIVKLVIGARLGCTVAHALNPRHVKA